MSVLALLAAAALEGFPDADLPRFCPARAGMVTVMRYVDLGDGRTLDTATQVTQQVDRPDGVLARVLARTRDVRWDGQARSQLQEGTILRDRVVCADLDSDREPTIELRTPLRPGASWTYPLTGGQGRRTILGVEAVTVPAGTFERALHVQVRSRYEQGGRRRELTSDLWYAPDAGLVKVLIQDPRTGRDTVRGELVSLRQDPVPTRRP